MYTNNNINYKDKYLKYKNKYLELKYENNMKGGAKLTDLQIIDYEEYIKYIKDDDYYLNTVFKTSSSDSEEKAKINETKKLLENKESLIEKYKKSLKIEDEINIGDEINIYCISDNYVLYFLGISKDGKNIIPLYKKDNFYKTIIEEQKQQVLDETILHLFEINECSITKTDPNKGTITFIFTHLLYSIHKINIDVNIKKCCFNKSVSESDIKLEIIDYDSFIKNINNDTTNLRKLLNYELFNNLDFSDKIKTKLKELDDINTQINILETFINDNIKRKQTLIDKIKGKQKLIDKIFDKIHKIFDIEKIYIERTKLEGEIYKLKMKEVINKISEIIQIIKHIKANDISIYIIKKIGNIFFIGLSNNKDNNINIIYYNPSLIFNLNNNNIQKLKKDAYIDKDTIKILSINKFTKINETEIAIQFDCTIQYKYNGKPEIYTKEDQLTYTF